MQERMARAFDFCGEVTKNASSTFYLGTRFFPKEQQRYLWAIYAFCRHVDDLVDESGLDAEEIEKRLAVLRSILKCVREPVVVREYYSKELELIVTALREVFRLVPTLTSTAFLDLLDGVAMDLNKQEFNRMDDLLSYCDKVAGGVGQMVCELCGVVDANSILHAREMGNAMQITNVLRDVDVDQQKGRRYLPTGILNSYGVVWPVSDTDGLREVVKDLAVLNHAQYQSARRYLRVFPFRIRMALNTAAMLYEGILDDISNHRYEVMHRRAYVQFHVKIWILCKSLLASIF